MRKFKRELEAMIKSLRLKLAGSLIMVLALGVLAVSSVVAAKSGAFDWLAVQKDVANQIADSVIEPALELEPSFGSMASPFRYNPIECNNGDCVAPVSVDFIDASTTILSVVNPFRAVTSTNNQVVVETLYTGYGLMAPTSTVDLVRLNITGAATTTYSVFCSNAETAYATSTANSAIIETGTSVTSTPILENNMSSAALGGNGYTTGSVAKLMVTPEAPYVICKVHGANDAAFTGGNNTFDGKGLVRFNRLQ